MIRMRARAVIFGGAVAGAALLAAAPAWAQTTTPTTEKLKHANEECIKLLEEGQDVSACQEAPNPILPATNELIWGSISFVVLFFLLQRFAFPAIRTGMDARAERIRASLAEAEQAKTEAESILAEYQAKLADARAESARIIEEARQSADKLRQDLRRQSEAEVAASKQRAQEEIEAAVARATADLRTSVRELTLELAEKVVERNLDRDTNLALIDQFIDEISASRT
jgi:F-type H+-transporting ATPase subunit b